MRERHSIDLHLRLRNTQSMCSRITCESRGGEAVMSAKPPDLTAQQRSDPVRASDPRILKDSRRATLVPDGARWHPSGEAVGGAIAGGVVGGTIFGPIGAIAGMLVGAAIAVGTTRHF